MPAELMEAELCGHRTLIELPPEESALIGHTVRARFQLLRVSRFGQGDIHGASESRCLRLRFPQKKSLCQQCCGRVAMKLRRSGKLISTRRGDMSLICALIGMSILSGFTIRGLFRFRPTPGFLADGVLLLIPLESG